MSELPSSKFPYNSIANDPFGVRIYTLSNGLKVFLSVNKNEPRIYTNIAFKVGSKHDPADTTGLAHYMEHMLFKGTSKIGTTNWKKESELLEQIANKFEVYRQTSQPEERKQLYKEIDQLSYEAALLVAPNEYDRLATAIGAKSTNAYTWLEQTVYINDIPSNELARWVKLERERFRYLALRLFHTELETVYEEYNMSQDKDFRKVYKNLREMLFPNHPYGTQTTLGSPEHLKNPSMRNIEHFFSTYYVPSNAAIALSGDFDPDEAIALIEAEFGTWENLSSPPFKHEEQPPITTPRRREVLGQESEYAQLAWRCDGASTDDLIYTLLVRQMLYNQQAGLIDLNINQQQKLLEASAFNSVHTDYSMIGLYGKPREGQSLEEVEELLLQEVRNLQNGTFPDWLLEASIKDLKLSDLKAIEQNESRVGAIINCFVLGIDWNRFVHRYDVINAIDKAAIIRFANEKMNLNSYAVVYKRMGTDTNIVKVEKPDITAAPLQKEASSEYAHSFLDHQTKQMDPVFGDFQGLIQRNTWQEGLKFDYVHNPHNPLFRLDYIFEMGENTNKEIGLAFAYLSYLGTSRYSAAEIQQAFFQLGLHFELYSYDERCHVSLTGLEESLEKGILLMEHILNDVQPNADAWNAVVTDILTKRINSKQNKNTILSRAMASYARFGENSSFTNRIPEAELQKIDPAQLLHWIKDLHTFEHRIYYYGQLESTMAANIIKRHHKVANTLKKPLITSHYTENATTENKVFFTPFPMVQNDLLLLSRGTPHFNIAEHSMQDLYNEYFGYGLSSVVFQEMREAKALAYSTYAYYSSPTKANRSHYLRAYVGTQPDKVSDALPTLTHLLENMPIMEQSIEQARLAIIQRIESDRIAPRKLYWEAQSSWDINLQHDILQDIYQQMQEVKPQDLLHFHEKQIKGRHYNLMVIGDEKTTPLKYLEQFGEIQQLTKEELFGF